MRACLIGFALALAGCNNDTITRPPLPDGALAPEDLDLGGNPPVATTAVITTSSENFMGGLGALHTVRLADKQLTKNIETSLDVDNVVRAAAGKVFVLDRTHGSLRVYDPAQNYMNPVEITTGDATAAHDSSDPADVYPIPSTTKVYVALYGNDAAHAVGVIDTTKPGMGVIKWIAIPAAGSPLPRAAGLWFCGPYLYVLLDDLDASFKVTGPGRLAVIDPGADALVTGGGPSVIALTGYNPALGLGAGITASSPGACDNVLVAQTGDFNQMDVAKRHAGIEQVDLTGRASQGMLLSATDLGGTPNTISGANRNLAYAIVNLPDFTQKVVAIDPLGKKVLPAVAAPAATISFAAVSPDGQLFIGVARGNAAMGQLGVGVYVGPVGGAIAANPIDLGQAPYGISFY